MEILKHSYSAVDIVVLKFRKDELFVYLVKLANEHLKGALALPGALVKDREMLEETAERIFFESTGKKPFYCEQLYTFSDPERDPRSRSISTAYLVFPQKKEDSFSVCSKYVEGEWFNAKALPILAYDHNQIIDVALSRIAAKLNYTTLAFMLLEKEFTLTELQKLYEYFFQTPFDKRNFRNRILSLGIVKETGGLRSGDKFRPAKLYRPSVEGVQTISLFA